LEVRLSGFWPPALAPNPRKEDVMAVRKPKTKRVATTHKKDQTPKPVRR